MGSDEAFASPTPQLDALEARLRNVSSEEEGRKLRLEIEAMLAKASTPQQMAIFNIDKQETRDAIMTALASKAPGWGCMMPEPELSVMFENGLVKSREVCLPGYGSMSADDAEALCFALYAMAVRARDVSPGTLSTGT